MSNTPNKPSTLTLKQAGVIERCARSPGFSECSDNTSASETVWLYRSVFSGYTRLLIVALFMAFLVQPLHRTYAAESDESTGVPTMPESISVEEAPVVQMPTANQEVDADSATDSTVPSNSEIESASLKDQATDSTTTESTPRVATTNESITATTSPTSAATIAATDTPPNQPSASTTEGESVEGGAAAPTTATTTAADASSSTAPAAINASTSSPVLSPTATSASPTGATTTPAAPTSTSAGDEMEVDTDSAPGGGTSGSSAPDSATSSTSVATSAPATADTASTSTEGVETDGGSVVERDTPNAETASSSDSLDTIDSEPSPPLVSIVESDSAWSFNRDQCTRIEDGSFYCQKPETSDRLEDGLIAAPDAEGDLEIFLVRDGVRTQITQNTVDDAAPYYDAHSDTIVWHRLIQDRYQIVVYDVASGEESLLTDSTVNNMQPTRYKGVTVWQRWVDDNWEIFMHDGSEQVQVTDSPEHDIAPHVRGGLIIWNTRASDGRQQLKTYDMERGLITSITDDSGVSVTNPRMVVMYEARYENGDVVVKGFDITTGETVPLQSLPRDLPDELPGAEETGETKALIQNKPNGPREAAASSTGTTTTPGTATSTAAGDTLDLRTASTTVATTSNSVTVTIPDVVVPPASTTLATVPTSTQSNLSEVE